MTSARRKIAGISASSTKRVTKRTLAPVSAAASWSGSPGLPGVPALPNPAPPRGERLEQVLEPLVWAEQAEGEDDRPLGALELRRQRLLLGEAGEVVEG